MERENSYTSTQSAETVNSTSLAGNGNGMDSTSILVDRTSRLDELFGAAYLLGVQGWEHSRRYVALVALFEFLQTVQYIISPLWAWPQFSPHVKFWKVFYYGQLQRLFTVRGWGVFIGIGYTLVAIVWLEVLMLVYVALLSRNGKTGDKELGFWKKQMLNVLRVLVCVFQELFFLSILNTFMVPLACDWQGNVLYKSQPVIDLGTSVSVNGTTIATGKKPYQKMLIYFPKQDCFAKGNKGHMAIMAITASVHVLIGLMAAMRRFNCNLASTEFLTFFNATYALRKLSVKVVLSVVYHVVSGWKPELTTGIMFVGFIMVAWFTFRRQIYNNVVFQLWKSAATALFVWLSLLLFLGISFESLVPMSTANFVAFIGAPYVMWLGATLSEERRRWNFMAVCKFAKHKTGTPVVGVHDFVDSNEPECVVRMLLRNRGTTVESHAEVTAIIEKVLQSARVQFPNSAHLAMLQASYTAFQDKNLGLAHSLLEKARRYQGVSRIEKWEIYILIREKQSMESSQISGEAMDVQTYVHYMSEFRSLAKQHRAAVDATKTFWRLFMKNEVRLRSILSAFHRIESTATWADLSYRAVLERYPKSTKLLRAYGKFLQDVKNDPYTAQKYLSEAEKLEQIAENNAQSYGMGDSTSRIDENRDAVVIISTEGVVEFANKLSCHMFGYTKDMLEGKNVSILMPEPFSRQHNSYLRTYAQTGKARILKQVREVVGAHRGGYVFPITIFVSKINQAGQEGFLGVIKSIPEDLSCGRAWLSPAGSIFCISRGFTDLLGYKPDQVLGRYFGSFALESDAETLATVMTDLKDANDPFGSEPSGREISFRHRYGGITRVSLSMHFAGTETVRMYVVQLRPVDEKTGTLVINQEGTVCFADSRVATLLSHDRAQLEGRPMDTLLPRPLGALHSQAWLKRRQVSGYDAPCMHGRTICLRGGSGRTVYAALSVQKALANDTIPGSGKNAASGSEEVNHSFRVSPSSFDAWVMDQKITLAVSPQGNVTSAISPPSTLEYFPAELVGSHISAFIEGLGHESAYETFSDLLDNGTKIFRSGWRGKSGATLPAILELDRAPDGVSLGVYRVDRLEVILEVGRLSGVIIDSSELAHIVFGCNKEELRQRTVQQLLPTAFKAGRPEELLGLRSRRNDATPERPFVGPRVIYRGVDRNDETVALNTIAIDEGSDQSFLVYMRVVEDRAVSMASMLSRNPSRAVGGTSMRNNILAAKELEHGSDSPNAPGRRSPKPGQVRGSPMRLAPLAEKPRRFPGAPFKELAAEEAQAPPKEEGLHSEGSEEAEAEAAQAERHSGEGGSDPSYPTEADSPPGPASNEGEGEAVEGGSGSRSSDQASDEPVPNNEEEKSSDDEDFIPRRSRSRPTSARSIHGTNLRGRSNNTSGRNSGASAGKSGPSPNALEGAILAAVGQAKAIGTGAARGRGPSRLSKQSHAGDEESEGDREGDGPPRLIDGVDRVRPRRTQAPAARGGGAQQPSLPVVEDGDEEGEGADRAVGVKAGKFGGQRNNLSPIKESHSNFASAQAAAGGEYYAPRGPAAGTGNGPSRRSNDTAMSGVSAGGLGYSRKGSIEAGGPAPRMNGSRASVDMRGGNSMASGDDINYNKQGVPPTAELLASGVGANGANGDEDSQSVASGTDAGGGGRTGGPKRFKKILKIIYAGRTQLALSKLAFVVRLALLALILMHVGFFVLAIQRTLIWKGTAEVTALSVRTPQAALHATFFARNLEAAGLSQNLMKFDEAYANLVDEIDEFEFTHQKLYLDIQKAKNDGGADLIALYEVPSITIFYFNPAGQLQSETLGLWDLGNRFIAAARSVTFQSTRVPGGPSGLGNTTDFLFVKSVGPNYLAPALDRAGHLQAERYIRLLRDDRDRKINAILLVELCCVLPIAAIVIAWAVLKVSRAHRHRFAVFLQVPKRDVFGIITQRTSADDLDDDNSESEGEGAGRAAREQQELGRLALDPGDEPGAKQGGKGGAAAAAGAQRRRKLVDPRATRSLVVALLPMAMFAILIVTVVVVTYIQIEHQRQSALEVYGVSQLDQAGTRGNYQAMELLIAAVRGDNTSSWRSGLITTSKTIETNLRGIMYGNDTLGIPPRLLAKKKIWSAIFSRGCRRVLTKCPSDDDPMAFRTQNGLDILIRDLRQTWYLAALQPDAYLTPNNTRLRFGHDTFNYDFHDAFESLEVAFNSHTVFVNTVQAIYGLLFGLCCIFAFFYYRRVLRPHFRILKRESELIAGLLSQVPGSVPLESVLMQHYLDNKNKKAKRKPSLARGLFGKFGAEVMPYGFPQMIMTPQGPMIMTPNGPMLLPMGGEGGDKGQGMQNMDPAAFMKSMYMMNSMNGGANGWNTGPKDSE